MVRAALQLSDSNIRRFERKITQPLDFFPERFFIDDL